MNCNEFKDLVRAMRKIQRREQKCRREGNFIQAKELRARAKVVEKAVDQKL